jgi:hypothetical protein
MKNQTPKKKHFWKFVFIMEYVLLRITKQKHFDVRQYVWFHLLQGIIADAEFWMGFPVLNGVKCPAVLLSDVEAAVMSARPFYKLFSLQI